MKHILFLFIKWASRFIMVVVLCAAGTAIGDYFWKTHPDKGALIFTVNTFIVLFAVLCKVYWIDHNRLIIEEDEETKRKKARDKAARATIKANEILAKSNSSGALDLIDRFFGDK